jgi:hypothetical protein
MGCSQTRGKGASAQALPQPRCTQPPGARERDAMPYSMRSEGIIGNLGWDSPPETLIANTKAVLIAAGALASDVVELKASYEQAGGTSVDIKCFSPTVLQKLRRLARDFKMVFRTDAGATCAWIDYQKTRDEMRPSRLVRRAAAYLRDVDAQRCIANTDLIPYEIVADFRGKFIAAGPLGRVGGSIAGWFRFFPSALVRYTQETLDVGRKWVHDE